MNTDNIKFHYNLHKEKGETLNVADVELWADAMLKFIVPDLNKETYSDLQSFEKHVKSLNSELKAFLNVIKAENIDDVVDRFFDSLKAVSDKLDKDFMAFYQGDPAAKSLSVVKLTYPGVLAIAMHRLANVLHERDFLLIL